MTESAAPSPENLEDLFHDDNPLIHERRQKLHQLRSEGVAYPNDFVPTHQAAKLSADYGNFDKPTLESHGVEVSIAGRMMLKRVMGKASFATLQDQSGRIQIYISQDYVGTDVHDSFKHWDIGDILAAEGVLFKTNKGELTVQCKSIRLLTKSLRPLPDKFHGLVDHELRYRRRYVDLIMSDETRDTFRRRAHAMTAIRQIMANEGFMEVETPMLHPIPGGAAAKPFVTHHNALDMAMYLRIAPELYLKRLLVGGFERVYEINRNFRNEGVSPRHNPEFTMMEFYAAYWNYLHVMAFTEKIIRETAIAATGSAVIPYGDKTIHLDQPFLRLTMVAAICKVCPEYTAEQLHDATFVWQEIQRLNLQMPGINANSDIGQLQLRIFEEKVEHHLWEPTFIIDYPVAVSPLARASDQQPTITERFELFITGREIANGFSELNDPEDQARRFHQQVAAKEAGDEEAMFYDADYIRALEYGMPPAGGCGIGIDRLMMLITNRANIRDVILFPHLRHEEAGKLG